MLKTIGFKICIFLLFIYTICWLFGFAIFKLKNSEKYEVENCFIHSSETLELQNSFKNKVDANLEIMHSNNEFILPSLRDERKNNVEDWVEIAADIFIYSAYIFTCESDMSSSFCVKLVGAILDNNENSPKNPSSIICMLKNRDGDIWESGPVIYEKIPESHAKRFTAALIYCLFPENEEKSINWPKYVTLVKNQTENSTWIQVQGSISDSYALHSLHISVCVRPFYGSYSVVLLSEFLAYYSVMGVDHFIFYRQNTTGAFDVFLNIIKTLNISIEILSWNPLLNNDNIHEYGQIVFTQECAAHSQSLSSSHTIIVDLDEYMVPKQHEDLRKLIIDLDQKYPLAGSYVVPMSLFCNEFEVGDNSTYPPLHVLVYNHRQSSTWEHWYRSKYIIKPERILHAGIHFVWKHKHHMKEVKLSEDVVLLHHYRRCCGMQQMWFFQLLSFEVLGDNPMEDNSLVQYKNLILNHTVIGVLLRIYEYLP